MTENFNKLTELQRKVGYKEGPLNIVAVLGLAGETGEALEELLITKLPDGIGPWFEEGLKSEFVATAKKIDTLKKAIRDKKHEPLFVSIKDETLLDKELADILYYLNALAINRGKTLDYYAGLSVEKVLSKKATNISHGAIDKPINP